MKIKEILSEGGTGSLTTGAAHAMPNLWELPGLPNQDPYYIYRMGLAMASARSDRPFDKQSAFGENMSVVGYTEADNETVKMALKKMGAPFSDGAHSISTTKSEEAPDVNKSSPTPAKKRNRYGV